MQLEQAEGVVAQQVATAAFQVVAQVPQTSVAVLQQVEVAVFQYLLQVPQVFEELAQH
mgnify:FL=1